MSGTGGFNQGSGHNHGGQPVPPFVVDSETGDSKDNEFIHTPETDEANPNHKNEADKEKEQSDEDFVEFDVDKVDELEKTKEQSDENENDKK